MSAKRAAVRLDTRLMKNMKTLKASIELEIVPKSNQKNQLELLHENEVNIKSFDPEMIV